MILFNYRRVAGDTSFMPDDCDDVRIAENLERAVIYAEQLNWQGEAVNLIFAGAAAEHNELCGDETYYGIRDRLCDILLDMSHYRNN